MNTFAGALHGTESIAVRCPAPDCAGDHETYAVGDIIMVLEGMPLEEAQSNPHYEEALEFKLLKPSSTKAYPTILGVWWDAQCDN